MKALIHNSEFREKKNLQGLGEPEWVSYQNTIKVKPTQLEFDTRYPSTTSSLYLKGNMDLLKKSTLLGVTANNTNGVEINIDSIASNEGFLSTKSSPMDWIISQPIRNPKTLLVLLSENQFVTFHYMYVSQYTSSWVCNIFNINDDNSISQGSDISLSTSLSDTYFGSKNQVASCLDGSFMHRDYPQITYYKTLGTEVMSQITIPLLRGITYDQTFIYAVAKYTKYLVIGYNATKGLVAKLYSSDGFPLTDDIVIPTAGMNGIFEVVDTNDFGSSDTIELYYYNTSNAATWLTIDASTLDVTYSYTNVNTYVSGTTFESKKLKNGKYVVCRTSGSFILDSNLATPTTTEVAWLNDKTLTLIADGSYVNTYNGTLTRYSGETLKVLGTTPSAYTNGNIPLANTLIQNCIYTKNKKLLCTYLISTGGTHDYNYLSVLNIDSFVSVDVSSNALTKIPYNAYTNYECELSTLIEDVGRDVDYDYNLLKVASTPTSFTTNIPSKFSTDAIKVRDTITLNTGDVVVTGKTVGNGTEGDYKIDYALYKLDVTPSTALIALLKLRDGKTALIYSHNALTVKYALLDRDMNVEIDKVILTAKSITSICASEFTNGDIALVYAEYGQIRYYPMDMNGNILSAGKSVYNVPGVSFDYKWRVSAVCCFDNDTVGISSTYYPHTSPNKRYDVISKDGTTLVSEAQALDSTYTDTVIAMDRMPGGLAAIATYRVGSNYAYRVVTPSGQGSSNMALAGDVRQKFGVVGANSVSMYYNGTAITYKIASSTYTLSDSLGYTPEEVISISEDRFIIITRGKTHRVYVIDSEFNEVFVSDSPINSHLYVGYNIDVNNNVTLIFSDQTYYFYTKLYTQGTDITISFANQGVPPTSAMIPNRFVVDEEESRTFSNGVITKTMYEVTKSGRVLQRKIVADRNVEVIEPLIVQLNKG